MLADLTQGLRHVDLNIHLPLVSFTTTVSRSTQMNLERPSHILELAM